MDKKLFSVQELEQRFEMEMITLPDGQMVDVSSSDLAAKKIDSECTSTCKPK